MRKVQDPMAGMHTCRVASSSGSDRCTTVKSGKVNGKAIERVVCWWKGKRKAVSLRYRFGNGWGGADGTKQAKAHCASHGGEFHAGTKDAATSLLPSLTEALNVHDAAHELESQELHNLAIRLLSLVGQPHISTEDWDKNETHNPVWDELPAAIQVSDEAASITGSILYEDDGIAAIVATNPDAIAALEDADMGLNIIGSDDVEGRSRIPAYELWLIRKDKPCVEYPQDDLMVGEYIPVGYFRKQGAYKFPVIVQPIPNNYEMYQIHKMEDGVAIYNQDGERNTEFIDVADGLMAMDDLQSAIFIALRFNDTMFVFDVLQVDGRDCKNTILSDRIEIIDNFTFPEGIEPLPIKCTIDSADDLSSLGAGQFLVRYENEILDDMLRPFWFVYTEAIRIGQPLPPAETSDSVTWKSEDDVLSALEDDVVCAIPDGIAAQIHRGKHNTAIFVGKGGRNRAHEFPGICEAVAELEMPCIIECIISSDNNGEPIPEANMLGDNLTDMHSVAYCYDIAYLDDVDLTQLPMEERRTELRKILHENVSSPLTIIPICDNFNTGIYWTWPKMGKRADGNWKVCTIG